MRDDLTTLFAHLFKSHFNVKTSTVKSVYGTYYCAGVTYAHVSDFMFYALASENIIHYSAIFHYGKYGRLTLFNENELITLFNKDKGIFSNLDISNSNTTLYGTIPKDSFNDEFISSVIDYFNNSELIHWFDRVEFKCGNESIYEFDKISELVKQNATSEVILSEITKAKRTIFYYPKNTYFSKDTFVKITNFFLMNEHGSFQVIERLVPAAIGEIENTLNFLLDAKILVTDPDFGYILASKSQYYFLFDLVRPDNQHNLSMLFLEE